MIPAEGLNYMLNTSFKGGAAVTTWYIGLMADYIPASTDTNALIAAQEVSAYTVAAQAVNRGVWVPSVPAAGSLDSIAAPITVTFTAPVTIFGAFISSSPVKGGAVAGVLASIERFPVARSFLAGETLDVSALISSTGV